MSRGEDKKLNKRAYLAIGGTTFVVIILILLFVMEARKNTPDIPTLFESLVVSILCSIVASIIYSILQRGFSDSDNKPIVEEIIGQLEKIEKSLQIQNALYDSGISSIHPKTHFDNEESYWNNIINGTNKRLDLIGHSLSNWFKREYKSIFIAKLKQILESENDVNIILSAESIDLVKVKEVFLEKKENILSKVEKTVLYLCQILNEIPEDKQQYLNVYITNLRKVTYLYIRTDEQCIISPYIYSKDSNNNSFLLELQPRTSYVKSLEDDFEEMISGLEQIDLTLKKYTYDKNKLVKLDWKTTENRYSGSDWNFEKTEKYIYGDGSRKYEVGYFEHYAKNMKYVKSVIELPVSYGCPSKCLFCASSNIDDFGILRAEQMFRLFDEIYTTKELNKSKRVLLSITGMGDLYFNEDQVFKFLLSLTEYENLAVTLSSSYWDTKLLNRAWELKEKIQIRYIQLTYISDLEDDLMKVIPLRGKRKRLPEVSDFIDFVAQKEEKFFRINYLVICDVNDSEEAVRRFIKKYSKIKEKIVVRISRLNETNATRRNALHKRTIEKLNFLKNLLRETGYTCYVFYSYENDNMNCGQLLTELP